MRGKILFLVFLAGLLLLFGSVKGIFQDNTCANSISCIKDLSGTFEALENEGVFHGQKATLPEEIAKIPPSSAVLGEQTANKRIEVDLTNQRVYAFENDAKIFEFPVSSGKWYPTPTGEFQIWIKLRYTKMEGGNKAIRTYYYLPNVPYVMFFYNNQVAKSRGFGLHGTYWHDNFGHPMSHGCVNMRTEDVEKLYYWATPVGNNTRGAIYAKADNPGTKVVIYGETPKE